MSVTIKKNRIKMDEYIVPDNEVEIVSAEEHVATEEVVRTVCYEVPVTFQPGPKTGMKTAVYDNSSEPGEYIEGGSDEIVGSLLPEEENYEKLFKMIPRTIMNPQTKKTTFITQECVYVLIKWIYERRYNPFPTESQKEQLATITKLPRPEIDVWLAAVRKTIVPKMITKGADFLNNFMKYHVENVKAQGRISVANFQNKRLLLKRVGNEPVIIGKIQYSSQSSAPQKVQYVVPIKMQKFNNSEAALKETVSKNNYESGVQMDTSFDENKSVPEEITTALVTKPLDMNAARYLMTWLFNYRDNPFPSLEQLRHISDVTGLSAAQVQRWLFTATRKILKKVRQSNTVLPPEMFKDSLVWHLNDLPGPKRSKILPDVNQSPPQADAERKIRNSFELSNHKKSPFKMEMPISGDDSFNGESYEMKRSHVKKPDRSYASNKRLFIKSDAEELHPSDPLRYDGRPTPVKGASRKGKGNFPLSSKKVLMDWLFNNRHNPYPTDQEKAELSSMSNLTLLQVNNWFINARRRFLDKMLKSGEECFLIKRQNKGFKELSKSYLRESGEVETEIVTYTDEIMLQDEHHQQSQQGHEIEITEYVCEDGTAQPVIEYHHADMENPAEYHMEEATEVQEPYNGMIEVQVHLLPTKYEEQGSVVRVRCTEEEAVHVLKAVNSHPVVALNKVPDPEPSWDVPFSETEEEVVEGEEEVEIPDVEQTTEVMAPVEEETEVIPPIEGATEEV